MPREPWAVNGTLVLTADAQDPLEAGLPAPQAYTAPVRQPTDIRWHAFSVRPAGTEGQ